MKLGGRAFDVLLALVERRDRTVGMHELIDLAAGLASADSISEGDHVGSERDVAAPGRVAAAVKPTTAAVSGDVRRTHRRQA